MSARIATDPYFDWLQYRGSNGAVVELQFELTGTRNRRARWWWRKLGEQQWYGGDGHSMKLAALNEAAHHFWLSGEAFDAQPVTSATTPPKAPADE